LIRTMVLKLEHESPGEFARTQAAWPHH
jgi:hypothetical protein